MAKEIVIASACRTAIGKFGGTLKDVPAVELGATVIKEAVNRAGLKPEQIDEVIMGGVIMILRDYVKQPFLCGILRLAAAAVIVVMVALRLLCGCHWFTDILVGILASGAMLALFGAVIDDEGEGKA